MLLTLKVGDSFKERNRDLGIEHAFFAFKIIQKSGCGVEKKKFGKEFRKLKIRDSIAHVARVNTELVDVREARFNGAFDNTDMSFSAIWSCGASWSVYYI